MKLQTSEKPGIPLSGAVEGAGQKRPDQTARHILIVIAIVLAGLLIASHGVDKSKVLKLLTQLKLSYLGLAATCFFIFMLFEALSYKLLLRSNGYRVSIMRSYIYALSDYFFSSISPGGSAGQFGQFYMMQRDGISAAACLSSLFSFNMLYHLILCLFAIFAFVCGAVSTIASNTASMLIVAYGIGAQVLFSLCIAALLFSTRLAPKIIRKLARMARRNRLFKRFAPSKEKTEQFLDEYKLCGKRAKENPLLLLKVSVLICLQMTALYSIPWFIAHAMGFNINFFTMLALQSLCVIATESIPLPGGAGASEIFFAHSYAKIMPANEAFGMMLVTRCLSLYLGIIVGGLAVSLCPRTSYIRLDRPEDGRPADGQTK